MNRISHTVGVLSACQKVTQGYHFNSMTASIAGRLLLEQYKCEFCCGGFKVDDNSNLAHQLLCNNQLHYGAGSNSN